MHNYQYLFFSFLFFYHLQLLLLLNAWTILPGIHLSTTTTLPLMSWTFLLDNSALIFVMDDMIGCWMPFMFLLFQPIESHSRWSVHPFWYVDFSFTFTLPRNNPRSWRHRTAACKYDIMPICYICYWVHNYNLRRFILLFFLLLILTLTLANPER